MKWKILILTMLAVMPAMAESSIINVTYDSASGYLLEDAVFSEDVTKTGTENFINIDLIDGIEGEIVFVKVSISNLTSQPTLYRFLNASICLMTTTDVGASDETFNVYHVPNQTWVSSQIDPLCGNGAACDEVWGMLGDLLTTHAGQGTTDGQDCVRSLQSAFQTEWDSGNGNVSFAFNHTGDQFDFFDWDSLEATSASSRWFLELVIEEIPSVQINLTTPTAQNGSITGLNHSYFNNTLLVNNTLDTLFCSLDQENITVSSPDILIDLPFADGNWNDTSQNERNGSNVNSAACSAVGRYGKGCMFEGLNDRHVDYGNDTSFNLPGDFCIMGWTNLTSTGESGFGRVLDKRGTLSDGWSLRVNDSNYLMLEMGAFSAKSDPFALHAGEWQHFAVNHNASTTTFYVNGTHRGRDMTVVNASDSALPLLLGIRNGLDREFDGTLDQIRLIKGRACSEEEISQHYRAEIGNYFVNLTSVSEGWHDLYCAANDTVGNYTATSPLRTFAVDLNPPSWNDNSTNASSTFPFVNDAVQFVLNATDGIRLEALTFAWNVTGAWANQTTVLINGTQMRYAFNFSINNTADAHDIGWRVFINDTVGRENVTPVFLLGVVNSNITANITLNATPLESVQDVLCSNVTFDADSDTLSHQIAWFINGTFFGGVSYDTPILSFSNTTTNANITCQYNMTDGYQRVFFNSSTFTVGDAMAPVTGIASFDAGSYAQNDLANVSLNCTDDNQVAFAYAHVYSHFDSGATLDGNLSLENGGDGIRWRQIQLSGTGTYGILAGFCVDGSGNAGSNFNATNVTVTASSTSSGGGGGGGGETACFNPASCAEQACCFGYVCSSNQTCVLASDVIASEVRCGDGVCHAGPPNYENALWCSADCPFDSGFVFCTERGGDCLVSSLARGLVSNTLILVAAAAIGLLLFLPGGTKK